MKKKLSNFWYYYKWYVLFCLLVLWAAFNFLLQFQENVEPDAAVSFVTMQQVPEEVQNSLQSLLSELVTDVNGDGKVEVAVNVYAYDGEGSAGTNADGYAAAAVHLASEVKLGLTSFFVTDEHQVLEDAGPLVQRGTWAEYSALMDLEEELLPDFRIYVFQDGEDDLLEQLK
jgi:hypothetical protein